jgi:hypothetical protein
MPTRKIRDIPWDRKVCYHPEHDPPGHMVYQPGVWEHTCPGCGKVTVFTVYPTMCCMYINEHREPSDW